MSVSPSKINIKPTLFLWIFLPLFQRPSHHSQFLCAFSPSRAVQNWYLKNAAVMLFHIYYLFLRFNFTYILYYDKRIWQSRNCLNIGGSFQSFLAVKIKVPMKTRFYIFSSFFRGTFSQNFTGSPSFHRFFYKFFQWLKLNFHDQKNLFSTGEITVFQWKAIFFGKGAWEYSVLAITIRFKNTRRLNFSRTQTIFKVVMLLPITGRNYCSRGGFNEFFTDCIKIWRGEIQGRIFFLPYMLGLR